MANLKANPVDFLDDKKTNKTIAEVKASQENLNKYLNMIWKGKRLKRKKRTFWNIIDFLMEKWWCHICQKLYWGQRKSNWK